MDTIRISKALGDPIRYGILLLLLERQNEQFPMARDQQGVCNCDIMVAFKMIQSRVSYHMRELVETGLVHEEQRGKWKYYSVNPGTLKDYLKQLAIDFHL